MSSYIQVKHIFFISFFDFITSGDFTFKKKKKDGTFSIISSPFINFHSSIHWFEDMDVLGASHFFSTEPYEHKIKILKAVAFLTNGKNPCEGIPLADFYKNLEKWKQPFSFQTTKPGAFSKSNRVYDDDCIWTGKKLYYYNSLKLESGVHVQIDDFVELNNNRYAQIRQFWGPSIVTEVSDVLIKTVTFKNNLNVDIYPMWVSSIPDQIEIISPNQIVKLVLGIPLDDELNSFMFDPTFKM
jgi:hypothetical protein